MINREKLLASRQRTLNEHLNKIRQYESERKIKHERLHLLEERRVTLRGQIAGDEEAVGKIRESLEHLEAEKATAEQTLHERQTERTTVQAGHEAEKSRAAAIQQELNDANQVYRSRQDGVYQLRKAVEIKQVQLSALRQELEKAT